MSVFTKQQHPPRELGTIRVRTISGWHCTLKLSIVYEKHPRFKGVFRGLNHYIPPKVIPFLRIYNDRPPYGVEGKACVPVDMVRLTKVDNWQVMLKAYLRQNHYTWVKTN